MKDLGLGLLAVRFDHGDLEEPVEWSSWRVLHLLLWLICTPHTELIFCYCQRIKGCLLDQCESTFYWSVNRVSINVVIAKPPTCLLGSSWLRDMWAVASLTLDPSPQKRDPMLRGWESLWCGRRREQQVRVRRHGPAVADSLSCEYGSYLFPNPIVTSVKVEIDTEEKLSRPFYSLGRSISMSRVFAPNCQNSSPPSFLCSETPHSSEDARMPLTKIF